MESIWQVTDWRGFNDRLKRLDNAGKGKAFELLTKFYFSLHPPLASLYSDIWLWQEVPDKVKRELKLDTRADLGIDILCRAEDGYHAIQCKYHADTGKDVGFREVSTFLALCASNPKVTGGYICTTADLPSRNLKLVRSEHIQLIQSDTWESLGEDFFLQARKLMAGKPVGLKPRKPLPHQKKAIRQAEDHFLRDGKARGKLIFPCGSGKSLTGYWITERLKARRVLIAVPSLALVKQTLEVYLRETSASGRKVKWLCICSDEGLGKGDDIALYTENLGVPCITDTAYIKAWIKRHRDEEIFVFTTYQSGKLIGEVAKALKFQFDLGIFDEAHKTVGSKDKLFSHLLFEEHIRIGKRVFMTATERFYRGTKDDIVSMDDAAVYGEVFAHMSFREAIHADPPLLTDYRVITIQVSDEEIAEFIRENGIVQLDDKWNSATEARSLASMIALRKAMAKYPIHNAVSFHSSIEKARRNMDIQEHLTNHFGYKPLDAYTVTGQMPTTIRSRLIREFASSRRALVTNARCLTEGVDVPHIDCIVFADPKRSKIDIVQALGRALRRKEGKEWGYVILPIIYDQEKQEIDNDSFSDIVAIVRALAANDERIVEYLRDKENNIRKPKGASRQFEFEVIADAIQAKFLKEQLEIRLWQSLASMNWLPFEEARSFARNLGLKSNMEWRQYVQSDQRPFDIPVNPDQVYSKTGQWTTWQDWLATKNPVARITTEEFIARSRQLHGGKYDYSQVDYVNNREPVTIICPIHGSFQQRPQFHMQGKGCQKCSSKDVTWATEKLGLEGFVKKARKLHGRKYAYNKVDYFSNAVKVIITCPRHGDYSQSPQAHLKGQGCKACFEEDRMIQASRNFLKRAKEVHGTKYDYSKVDYKGRQQDVLIVCPRHGEFKQRPGNHLAGNGCPYCANLKWNKAVFVEKALEVHGNRFDYSNTEFVGQKVPLEVVCKAHGPFMTTAFGHLNNEGGGCKECARSNKAKLPPKEK